MLIRWVIGMLESRTVISTVGNSTITKRATRGTPQGGVISTLLWLIVINRILLRFKEKRIKMIAYADDVVIMIIGKDLTSISEIMKSALKELMKWAEV